jgi:hypothetical protein
MSANDELQAHTCEKMLQEYGNVANNVAQANSQDLTEQWEKGELEIDKNYYLRFADGTEEIQLYVGAFLMRADNEVVEVLAPVPSYEEWQQLHKFLEEFNALEVAEENQQLKELLKECRVYVENCEQFNAYDFEMLKTIDNAIGEKK